MDFLDLNLSCDAENIILSQLADDVERKYSELLNFGDEDENLVLSQFADRVETDLQTINMSHLNSDVLSNDKALNFKISDIDFDQFPNLTIEEVDFQLTQDIDNFLENSFQDEKLTTNSDFPEKLTSSNSRFGAVMSDEGKNTAGNSCKYKKIN